MPDTIPGLLEAAATRDATKTWLRADDEELTFGQATAQVAGTMERLQATGVRPGDLVLVTARTTPTYLLAWLALTSMGAVAVTTDPELAPVELAGLAGQVRPRLVLTDDGLTALIEEAGVRGLAERGVARVEDLVDRGTYPAAGGSRLGSSRLGSSRLGSTGLGTTVGPDNLATLIPTSGTTGRSKLVMQTHRAYAMAGEGFPYWMELTAQDRLMTSLPLFHINAAAYSAMGSLACGAGLVLLPRFSASGFLDSARRHAATEFNAIGAMLEILMRQPERADDADTQLRLAYTGPSPTQERQEKIEARFGLRIVCGYAMSESPYGLIWPRGARPFGTLGTLRQHPTLGTVNSGRVVDEDGADVALGEVGELLLSNPVVTPGYWRMPEETNAAIVDGWLHTGDLMTLDADGIYTFVARKKEVLRRRGQNLSPAEVEEAILEHPDVLECAVVGVPSELSEEDVKAFVVLVPGRTVDFAELRTWAGQRLTAFKVPRFWQALDALPRTPTARVAKHRLPSDHPPDEYDAESTPLGESQSQPERQLEQDGR